MLVGEKLWQTCCLAPSLFNFSWRLSSNSKSSISAPVTTPPLPFDAVMSLLTGSRNIFLYQKSVSNSIFLMFFVQATRNPGLIETTYDRKFWIDHLLSHSFCPARCTPLSLRYRAGYANRRVWLAMALRWRRFLDYWNFQVSSCFFLGSWIFFDNAKTSTISAGSIVLRVLDSGISAFSPGR